MKAKVNYNDKEVEIELTDEQIEKINNTKFGDFRDIKTFKDACEAVDIEWQEPELLPEDVIAYMKLRIICKAINGGEWLDYSDTDKYKYYPYFYSSGSAPGFSCSGCNYVFSNRCCIFSSRKFLNCSRKRL